MKRLLLGVLAIAPLAFAQGPLAIGVKGGVPFTSNFETDEGLPNLRMKADTKRYTVGPVIELRGPLGLGVEFNALYRRLNYEVEGAPIDGVVYRRTTANAWDFPVLFKWRLGPGSVQPYVSVGPTFRHVSDVNQVRRFFTGNGDEISDPPELDSQFTAGFTVGGGLQLGRHLAPEIRYTRWGWENFRSLGGVLRSNVNQAEFLLGITF